MATSMWSEDRWEPDGRARWDHQSLRPNGSNLTSGLGAEAKVVDYLVTSPSA